MSEMIFRVHIPVWVDDNDTFDVEGIDPEEALEHVTGFVRDNEEIVWDINPVEGKVLNWNGNKVHFFDKVRDEGTYELIVDDKIVRHIEDYVPDFCCIGEDCYGDYMKFDVNEDGTIEGWTEGHKEAFYEYFSIITAKMVDRFGSIKRWFSTKVSDIEYEDKEGENAQVLSPETLIVTESGKVTKLEQLMLDALYD